MKDYIIGFKDYLKNQKKSSDNTLESYLRDIGQFLLYCNSNNINDVQDISAVTIEKYNSYLALNGKSKATVTRVAASMRCFFLYLTNIGAIFSNPVLNVKFEKAEKKLPEVLTSREVNLLLSQPDGSDYKSVRDKAMLELLYATGIKVSELIDLSVNDVNLQIGILHMRSAKTERIIPMYPAAIKAVAAYIANVRPIIVTESNEDRLFTNMNGSSLSRQGFWKIIKHYAAMADIEKDITPHTLRHSFAAHLLENGAQLTDIKEMLGHSDISSTQIYAQIMKNKYTQAYKRFHPLAR